MSFLFNKESGYLEGIVRGFKNGLLKQSDYLSLTQCEALEDLMTHIQSTDYGSIFYKDTLITVRTFETRLRERIVGEYDYIRNYSTEPLSTFLDYLRYPYMIDNIALLISGLKNRRSMDELLPLCHPLGIFDQMKAIELVTNTKQLFEAVLIDTPLFKYVTNTLSEENFSTLDVELLRGMLNKSYLEDFYNFCKNLGGTTADVMCNLLSFDADRRAIIIATNALTSNLAAKERLSLFPTCGQLHPYGLSALSNCLEQEHVNTVLSFFKDYESLFYARDTMTVFNLEDRLLMLEAKKNVLSFLQQFHFGIFYSYFKLKEIEYRNIVWIAECISQQQFEQINAFVMIPLD